MSSVQEICRKELKKFAQNVSRKCAYDRFAKEADVRFRIGQSISEALKRAGLMECVELHFETPLSHSSNWFPNLQGLTDARKKANMSTKKAWFSDIVVYNSGNNHEITQLEVYIEVKHFSNEQRIDSNAVIRDFSRLSSALLCKVAKSCFMVVVYDRGKYGPVESDKKIRRAKSRLGMTSLAMNAFVAVWEARE